MNSPSDSSWLIGASAQVSAALEVVQERIRQQLRIMEPILDQLQGNIRAEMERSTNLAQSLRPMLDLWEESLPPNWPEDLELEAAQPIIVDEGIPLVWVPRESIINGLTSAESRQARVQILLDRRDEVIEDCRISLSETLEESLAGQIPLAAKAVLALAGGHHEAALALSVVVSETAISRVMNEFHYAKVKKRVKVDNIDNLPFTLVRLWAALAPIDRFYTRWFENSDGPPPSELSRHVAVHAADISRYSLGDAVLAVMLMTSVLRGLQEYVMEGPRFSAWIDEQEMDQI